MPTFKVTLAYDGTDYVGWQRQANGVSIQGVVEDALRALDGRDVRVTGAGRTDAGVHALGQVAAFTIERALPPDAVLRALNAHLPDAIRALEAEEAAPTFHPRFGARTKTYRYRIWNGDVISPFERRYAWHLAGALDLDAMRAAARLLEGRHDFAAFQASGCSAQTTEREVFTLRIAASGARSDGGDDCGSPIGDAGPVAQSAVRTPPGAMLLFDIRGSGFLRHMVRIIVGSLVEVGRGRQPIDWIGRVLTSRDRTSAGPTAPGLGLFLVSVDYGSALAALS
jgi:tRNA pseudouridine38-40 synthase